MKKWFYALVLPVFVHVVIILSMNHREGIVESVIEFAYMAILVSFAIGLVVLIPTSIAQFLCARHLIRSNSPNLQLFLIGLLNPSIAISTLVIIGLILD